MNSFDDVLALSEHTMLASERSEEEQQTYRRTVVLLLQALENTMMAHVMHPETLDDTLCCFHIFPGVCCGNCHEQGKLTAHTLRDGRDIVCCCQATKWLGEHDLFLQRLSVGFRLF
jgi:hypothetical protein